MTLTDQIYAQALMLSGELSPQEDVLLRALCRASKATLAARLRGGITPEDCRADFITAGSLLALAAMAESDGSPERFTAGDLTVQRGRTDSASKCLRRQAELLMMPYVRDCFTFLGV